MAETGVGPKDVARLTAIMPDDRLHIVDDRDMPDVCLQHLLALMLLDGTIGFAAAHDRARMTDPAIVDLRKRIFTSPSKELTDAKPPRQAIIEIVTTGGQTLRHHTRAVLGTPENPMTWQAVADKASDLMVPILGSSTTHALIAAVADIDRLTDVRALRPLLQPQG
jgi:2-methylcitrate dehydratase PrpD